MPHYSDDELIDSLKECKKKHGEVSHTSLNKDPNLPSGPTFNYRFGSLSSALDEAGLSTESDKVRNREGKRTTEYTTNELITFLDNVSEDGEISRKMIQNSDGPGYQTIDRHASNKTVKEFVKSQTDYKFVGEYERKIRKKEVVEQELKKADENSNYLSISLLSSTSQYPSINEVVEHFGSLENAAEKLGLQTHGRISKVKQLFEEKHYLYVLSVIENGIQKFYVGETNNLMNRLGQHTRSESFDVQHVERIIIVDPNNVKNKERKLSLKIAREYDTTNVLGGK